MNNKGLLFFKNEKNEKYISLCDIFDLIMSSFIVGCIFGAVVITICLINYL